MRYLVTGGAGFIGSHFVHRLLQSEPTAEIINLDLLTYAGNLDNLTDLEAHPGHRFVKGDICDRDLVDDLMKQADVVVHFAAESFVDKSIYSAENFIRTDVYGSFVLLETARKYNLQKFIHISTDEVYGSCADGSFSEETPLMPTNPYAASKAAADRLAYSYYKTYDLPVLITRSCNNYGPNQYPEKLIPLFVTNALNDLGLPIYGDGKQVRDWLHVHDHCDALIFLLQNGKPGETYNISASQEFSNLAITEFILKYLKKPESLIQYVTDRPGHDRRYALSSDKLRSLGWQPKRKLEEGLRETINWYVGHEAWWKKIRERQEEFRNFYSRHYGTIGEKPWQTRPL